GAALLHAEKALENLQLEGDNEIGAELVHRALSEPAYLIAGNSGYLAPEVVSRIREMGEDDGFDALHERYGNMIEMGIVDPLRVVRSALQNGASVAGLLLTTNS